jgi:phage terminase Nu1 subunit (DNA packaging protein)
MTSLQDGNNTFLLNWTRKPEPVVIQREAIFHSRPNISYYCAQDSTSEAKRAGRQLHMKTSDKQQAGSRSSGAEH